MGWPRGSTTRPRNASPTGTESTRPVRLTCWPSSMPPNSPRMTTPISRTSRLSDTPSVPSENSSSSLAWAEGRPSTWAMPSPASATTPTSSREISGVYDETYRCRAVRISSAEMVSSAIWASLRQGGQLSRSSSSSGGASGLAHDSGTGVVEAAQDGGVIEVGADPDPGTADEIGGDRDLEVDVASVDARQRGRELGLLLPGQG